MSNFSQRCNCLKRRNSVEVSSEGPILLLPFLLRFLVRFSSSDGCERVNELRILLEMYPHLNIPNSSARSHASEEENRT